MADPQGFFLVVDAAAGAEPFGNIDQFTLYFGAESPTM